MELIRLSEDCDLCQSVSNLRTATNNVMNKVHKVYEITRFQRGNEFLTTLIISRAAGLLGGLDAINDSNSLVT